MTAADDETAEGYQDEEQVMAGDERGGLTPEKLAELRGWLEAQPERDMSEEMLPPWLAFEGLEPTSSGWRMGAGEDYMIAFHAWFTALDPEGKRDFLGRYPAPSSWSSFYAELSALVTSESNE